MEKKELYIFNPENDLALAFGEEGYTAPPAARQLRRDLQMLPAWYAPCGSTIMSENCGIDAEWLDAMRATFGVDISCMARNHLQNHQFEYKPWGWNLDLRRRLIGECVAEEQLPSVSYIDKLRELSHRAITIKLHQYISSVINYPLPPCPVELRTVGEVREFEREHAQCYVKAPWSSSGHGVYRVLEPESRNFEIWTRGVINRQGSVLCEAALKVVQDFAMEYLCKNGEVTFAGYSVFSNDAHSSFDSGIVSSREYLRGLISSRIGDSAILDSVKQAVQQFIAKEIAPSYDGYLGVDMMLYDDSGIVRINPCVELNLRMTMGAVTAIFGERYLKEGAVGVFKVTMSRSEAERQAMKVQFAQNQAVTDGNRLVAGILPLTPVYADSTYYAYIEIL